MKKIKTHKDWGIFQNNKKEVEKFGFRITVIHPDAKEIHHLCYPSDSEKKINTLEDAINYIDNY